MGEIIPLLDESFRGPCEWNEVLMELRPSSSVGSSGEDMMLEDRFGKRDRGGRRLLPVESAEVFLIGLSSECMYAGNCGGGGFSWVAELGADADAFSWAAILPIGDGDRSLLAPKKLPVSSTSSCRPRAAP